MVASMRTDSFVSFHRRLPVLVIVFVCGFGAAAPLEASSFRVASGKCEIVSNTCEVKIEGSGLSAAEIANRTQPRLADASPIDPQLSFEPGDTSDGAGTRTWSFHVTISAPLSALSQERKLAFSWGTASPISLSLTLVASAPKDQTGVATIKWTIEPPATPWNLGQDRWTEFTVTTADKELTAIVLRHSTYQDSRAGHGSRLSLDHFYLCPERTQKPTGCTKTMPLTDSTSTFWLTVDPQFDEPGIYSGNLEIGTQPPSDTKNISVTINQTSPRSQWIGFGLIVVGVTAAWLLLAFGRGRYSRNQALLPAVLLRERAAGLLLDLNNVPAALKGSAPNTTRELAKIVGQLTETYLDAQQFLPPKIPTGFGSAAAQTTAYQTFLQSQSQLVDNLDTIINQGILPAAQKWSATISGGDLTLLLQLITNLDALTPTLPQPANSLQTAITALLASWHPTVVAQAAGAAALTIVPPASKQPTSFQVLLRMEAVTIVFWIAWLVLTSLAGLLVLILPNPGFGGLMDDMQCLLWGFGLPVAGQSLQQLTVSSINSQLGVTLTKP